MNPRTVVVLQGGAPHGNALARQACCNSAYVSLGMDRRSRTDAPRRRWGATAVAPALPNMYVQPYPGCFTSLGAIAAFEGLYSSPLPVRPPVVPFTVDSTVEDMEASWLGRRGWDDDPILEIVGAQVFDKLIEALDFLLRRLLIARGLVRDASGAVHDIVFNVNGCV